MSHHITERLATRGATVPSKTGPLCPSDPLLTLCRRTSLEESSRRQESALLLRCASRRLEVIQGDQEARMRYESYRPGPPLSHFVDCFWRYENGPQPHARERGLPCGISELVIDLSDDLDADLDADRQLRPSLPLLRSTSCPSWPGHCPCVARGHAPFASRPIGRCGCWASDSRLVAPRRSLIYRPANCATARSPLDALWGAQAADLEEQLRRNAPQPRRNSACSNRRSSRMPSVPWSGVQR